MRWGKHRCPLCRKLVKPTIRRKYHTREEIIWKKSGFPLVPIVSVKYICMDCQLAFEEWWSVDKEWKPTDEWRKDWNEAIKVLSESEVV